MSKVVFILGAGASREGGGPLMEDFFDAAMMLWRNGKVSPYDQHFEAVFNAIAELQSVHSKAQLNLNNLETVFTTLELGRVLKKLPGHAPQQIEELLLSLKRVIAATLENKMLLKYRGNKINPHASYEEFTHLLVHLRNNCKPKLDVSVLTFNYDLGLDFALYHANLGADYCLDGVVAKPGAIPLLKLHGSLNWSRRISDGQITLLRFDQFFRVTEKPWLDGQEGFFPLCVSSNLKAILGPDYEDNPVIVQPTWNKGEHHQLLTNVWSRAAMELSEAESIIVMGYSLPETDFFFRLLYALGTQGKKSLMRFWVFDPNPTLEQKYRSMLGPGAIDRFEFFEKRFREAIATLETEFTIFYQ